MVHLLGRSMVRRSYDPGCVGQTVFETLDLGCQSEFMAIDHNFLDRIGLASKVMIKSEKVIIQK